MTFPRHGGSAAASVLLLLSGALSSASGMVEVYQSYDEGMNHSALVRAEEGLENPATDPGRLDIWIYRNHYQQASPDQVKAECEKTTKAIKDAVQAAGKELSIKKDCISFSSPASLKKVHAVKVTGLRKPFSCWKVVKELVTGLESVQLPGLSVVAPTYCTYRQDVKIPLWDVPYKVQRFSDMAQCMDAFGNTVVATTSTKAPQTLSTCDGTWRGTNFKEFALGAGKSMKSVTKPDLESIQAMAEKPPTDDETITSWEGSELWRTTHFVKVYQLIQDFGAKEEEAAKLQKTLIEGPVRHFKELNTKQAKEGAKPTYTYEVSECLPFAKGGVLYCTIKVLEGRGQGCLDLAEYLVSKESGGIIQFNVAIPSQCQYEDDLSKRLPDTSMKYTDEGPFEDMKSCHVHFRDEITSFTNVPQLLGLCDGKAFEGPGFRHWVGVNVLEHGKNTENAEEELKKQQALDQMSDYCKDVDPKTDTCKADHCAKAAEWIKTTTSNLKDTPLQMIIDRLAQLKIIILNCNQATTSLQKSCANSAVNPCTVDSCKEALQWLETTKDLEEAQIMEKLKALTDKTAKCNEAMDLFFQLCPSDEKDQCKLDLCKEASTWLMAQKDIEAKTIRNKVTELKKTIDDKCTKIDVGPDSNDPTIKFAKEDIDKLCGDAMPKCALEPCQEAQTWLAQAENEKKAIPLDAISEKVKGIKAAAEGCKKGLDDIVKFCDVSAKDEPCKFKLCKDTLETVQSDEALTVEKVTAVLTKLKDQAAKCKKIVDPKIVDGKKKLDAACADDNRYGKCGTDLCTKALERLDALGEDVTIDEITNYLKELDSITAECGKALDEVKSLCDGAAHCPALNCEDVLKGLQRDKELTPLKIDKAMSLLKSQFDEKCGKKDDDNKGPKNDDDNKGPKQQDDDKNGPTTTTGPKKHDDNNGRKKGDEKKQTGEQELFWVMSTPGSLTFDEPKADVSTGGFFTEFSVGRAGMVWAIDKSGNVWKCSDACKTGEWKQVELPAASKAVSVGAGLWEVWIADASDALWMRPVDGFGSWTRMYGTAATSVDLTTTFVYAVDDDNGVSRCALPCLTLEGEGTGSLSPWKSVPDQTASKVLASGDKVLLKTPDSKWLDASSETISPLSDAADLVVIDNKGKVVNVAKGTTVVLADLDWASELPNRNSCMHSEKCWGITTSNSVAVDLPPDARWVAGTGGLKFISVGRSWAYGFNENGAVFKRPYPSSDLDVWTLVSTVPVGLDIAVVPLADEEVWMVSDPPTPGKESVKIMRSGCGEIAPTDQDYLYAGVAKDGSSIYKGRRQTQFTLRFSSSCPDGGAWIVTSAELDHSSDAPPPCDDATVELKFAASATQESKLRPPFGSDIEVRKKCPQEGGGKEKKQESETKAETEEQEEKEEEKEDKEEEKEEQEEKQEEKREEGALLEVASVQKTMSVRLQESSMVYRQFAGGNTWTDTLVYLNEIDGGKEYIGGTVSFNKWNYCVLWKPSGPFKWVQVSKDENIQHVGVGNEYMFGLSADGSKFYRRKVSEPASAPSSAAWEDLSSSAPPEKLDVLMVSGEKDTLWGVDGQNQVWKSNPVTIAWVKADELTADELKFDTSASLVQLEEQVGHKNRSLQQVPPLHLHELDERITRVEISAEGSVHKADPPRPRAHYRNKRRLDPAKLMHVDSA